MRSARSAHKSSDLPPPIALCTSRANPFSKKANATMAKWTMTALLGWLVQCLLVAPTQCKAQDNQEADTLPESGYLQVYVEQDMLIHTDQNYTMGVGFEAMGHWTRWKYNPQYLMDWMVSSLPFIQLGPELYAKPTHSLMLFGTAFTPDSIEATEPVEGDRPYASLLGVVSSRTWAGDRYTITTQLGIGLLGLDLNERIQTWIHERRNISEPRGWHHQISNDGGEVTGFYSAGLRKKVLELANGDSTDARKWLDNTFDTRVSLGYYTNASVGTTLRFGWFRSAYSDSPPAKMRVGNQLVGIPPTSAFEVFGFGSVRGTLVGYNALLQGGRKATSYRLSSSKISRQVIEFEIGIRISFKRLYAAIAYAGRSPNLTRS